jgi:hypothetical protein
LPDGETLKVKAEVKLLGACIHMDTVEGKAHAPLKCKRCGKDAQGTLCESCEVEELQIVQAKHWNVWEKVNYINTYMNGAIHYAPYTCGKVVESVQRLVEKVYCINGGTGRCTKDAYHLSVWDGGLGLVDPVEKATAQMVYNLLWVTKSELLPGRTTVQNCRKLESLGCYPQIPPCMNRLLRQRGLYACVREAREGSVHTTTIKVQLTDMGAERGEMKTRATWGKEREWMERKRCTQLWAAMQVVAELAVHFGRQDRTMIVHTTNHAIQQTVMEVRKLGAREFLRSKWKEHVDTILHWQPHMVFRKEQDLDVGEGPLGKNNELQEELHLYPLHIRERDDSGRGTVVHAVSIRDWLNYFNEKRKDRVRGAARVQGDWSWHLSAAVLVSKRTGWCCDSRLQPLEMITLFNARHGGLLKSGMAEKCSWPGCTDMRSSLNHVLNAHGDWEAACTEASRRASRIEEGVWWWRADQIHDERLPTWLGYVPLRVETWLKKDNKNHKARVDWVGAVSSVFSRRAVIVLQRAHGSRVGRGRQRVKQQQMEARRMVKVNMGADGGLVVEDDAPYLVFGGYVDIEGVEVWEGYGRVRANGRVEGGASSTLAEYIANVGVLRAYQEYKWAHDLTFREAETDAIMDSKVVEGQTTGEFRCLEVPLRIGRDSMRRIKLEEGVATRHVMRNNNKRADAIAFKGRSGELHIETFLAEWDEQQADLRGLAERMGVPLT